MHYYNYVLNVKVTQGLGNKDYSGKLPTFDCGKAVQQRNDMFENHMVARNLCCSIITERYCCSFAFSGDEKTLSFTQRTIERVYEPASELLQPAQCIHEQCNLGVPKLCFARAQQHRNHTNIELTTPQLVANTRIALR